MNSWSHTVTGDSAILFVPKNVIFDGHPGPCVLHKDKEGWYIKN